MQGIVPVLFFLVNLPFTLAVGKNPSAPHLSILFRAAEKENCVAGECLPVPLFFLVNVPFTYATYFFFLCDQKEKVPKRKKSPPKTDLALRSLPMTARQIRFAQIPLESVIGKLRIRSSTGRHARNGRCWQSCRIDFAWLPGKHISQKMLANIGLSMLMQ